MFVGPSIHHRGLEAGGEIALALWQHDDVVIQPATWNAIKDQNDPFEVCIDGSIEGFDEGRFCDECRLF
ncbi:MAG: hypothetical protein ACYDDZ_10080 [Acidimicrobiales bacterium]